MKRFIKYFLCLLISLCVFAGTGCGFDVFGSGSGSGAGSDAPLIIRMLDIGQGDAILIERNGKFALIDTGDVEHRPRMAEYLRKYGVKKVDTVIITHPHGDHIGGMFSVFANAEIRQVYDNGVPTSLSTYKTYRKILDKRKIPRRTLRGGEKIQLLDDVPFTVVGPLEKSNARGENSRQNNESIVGLLKYGNFTMLFTGDAEVEEEASILKSGADVKSIVLKAGHHGSKTSSTEEFLRAVSPKAVFISCGAGNNYGHPSRQTMKRLEKWGIDVYRTDRQGTITLTTDGKRYEITKEH